MVKIVVILFALLYSHCIWAADGDDQETVDRIPANNDHLPPNVDPSSRISFESPKMSDEEQFSAHLPDSFKCDACTAIAFQMDKQLTHAEKSDKPMKESEYLDVFDKVCGHETYKSYGLKSLNGVNRISGEGLEANEHPGMMYGGGKWPTRLSSKCFELIGEHGEDEIYDAFRSTDDFHTFLCKELTTDCKKMKKKNKKKKKGKKSEL
eukprot:TCONS_00073210-protein